MISPFLLVALGGAVGSVLRYAVGLAALRMTGAGFPVSTLMVNVAGSFVMGIVAVVAVARGAGYLSPLVMTGLLGGFTTFSAFSLETVALWEQGAQGQALLYVALSVGLSVAALALGLWLARSLT